MTRWLILFGCVFAFAVAAPMGFQAEARKHKRCVAKTMEGKKVTWSCKAAQKCCLNWLENKGMCVGANDICL